MYDMLCNGCGHRTAMSLIDKVINEYGLKEKTIVLFDVACCSLLMDYVDYDDVMCPHGRVIDVSRGYKMLRKDKIVISYMGDGAAYAIGIEEMIHSARENSDLFLIVINNGLYSMTGGQYAPTFTGIDKSNLNSDKKDIDFDKVLKIENILKEFNISYLARCALTDKKNIDFSYECIKKQMDIYMNRGGFCLTELLSPCPTNYKMSIKENIDLIDENIKQVYKIGEFIVK